MGDMAGEIGLFDSQCLEAKRGDRVCVVGVFFINGFTWGIVAVCIPTPMYSKQ